MSASLDDPTRKRLSERSNTDRLWLSQFGEQRELIARAICVIGMGALLWAYFDSLLYPAWALTYLAFIAISYLCLRPGTARSRTRSAIGLVSYGGVAITFPSLPIYMLSSPDPFVVFMSTMALFAVAVFNLMREEPPAIVPTIDIAIGWAALAVAAASFIPQQESVLAQVLMGLLCLICGIYYTRALIVARTVRVDFRAEAQSSQHDKEREAISKLSGGIAHDFNNILTALQGNLDLYHEVDGLRERDALIVQAQEASARASGLVAQLLAFARRAPLTPMALPPEAVIEDAARMAAHTLPRGIDIETRLPEDDSTVLADAHGLQEALLALIQNAGEAMGETGRLVLAADTTQGSATADSGGGVTRAHLALSVADDGPGMDKEVARRATEPFFTTKTVGDGSGLGLSMAAGFAEQSGGALDIKTGSTGTIITLRLPLAPTATAPYSPLAQPAAQGI